MSLGSGGKVGHPLLYRRIVGELGLRRKDLAVGTEQWVPSDNRLPAKHPLPLVPISHDDNPSLTVEVQEEKTLNITGGVKGKR